MSAKRAESVSKVLPTAYYLAPIEKDGKCRIYFSLQHDIQLLEKVLKENPYQDISKWKLIAREMATALKIPFTPRNIRDRVRFMHEKFKRGIGSKQSGTEKHHEERNALLAELSAQRNGNVTRKRQPKTKIVEADGSSRLEAAAEFVMNADFLDEIVCKVEVLGDAIDNASINSAEREVVEENDPLAVAQPSIAPIYVATPVASSSQVTSDSGRGGTLTCFRRIRSFSNTNETIASQGCNIESRRKFLKVSPQFRNIADLQNSTMENVLGICVGSATMRELATACGSSQLHEATIKDRTGSIKITRWETGFDGVRDGDVLAIYNLKLTKCNGETVGLLLADESHLSINPTTPEASSLSKWYKSEPEIPSNVSLSKTSDGPIDHVAAKKQIHQELETTETRLAACERETAKLLIKRARLKNELKFYE